MAIPVRLSGDTAKPIELALADGYDYAGCVLLVDFCGVQRTFDNLVAGGTVELLFTAEETATFPLGTSKVFLSLRNGNGEVRHLPWAKIKVTDSPADLYDAQITIDPATLDVDDLTAGDSLGAVKTKLQAVIDFLRGLKVLAVCALPFFALADVAPLYTTPNAMPGDAPLMTNIQAYVEAINYRTAADTAAEIAAATNDLAQATLAKHYLVAPFRRGVNYARGDLVEINGRFYVFVGSWSGGSTADPVASGLVVELSDFCALAESLLAQSFLPLGEEGTNTQSRKTIETAYDRYGVSTYTFLPDGFEIRDLDGSTLKLQNTLFRYTDASTGTTKTLDLEEMIQFANVLPMYPQYMDAAHATNPTSPYYVGNYLAANYLTAADTAAEISAATNATLSAAKAYTDQSAAEIATATNATLSAAKAYADEVGSTTLSSALGNSQAYTDIAIQNLPDWAKASTKPRYTLNEVCPDTENWLGVPGTTAGGKSIKVLAKTVNGVIEGGMTVTGSSNNDNNTTKYRYGGVSVKRNGTNTDYLFDTTSQSGIVRRGELSTTVTSMIREQSLGGIWDDELQVWWTPVMSNGSLTYQATTNVNLNAEN